MKPVSAAGSAEANNALMPRPPARRPKPAPSYAATRETYIAKNLRLVHEDDDLLVVDKPAGMLSATPAGDDGDSVFAAVKDHVKTARAQRGTRAWIIHRLDREASGLMVFAKSERAYEMLKAELQARRMHRLYAAVVEGVLPDSQSQGTVQSFLYEDSRGTMHPADSPRAIPAHLRRRESDEELSAAKPAVTHYRVRATSRRRTLVEVKLETGRKHQIRAHMAQIGFPIVGDRRYDHKADPGNRLCLHAIELTFTHPATGQEARFTSDIPPAFYKIAGLKPGAEDRPEGRSLPTPRETTTPKPLDPAAVASSWNHVASWYDDLLEDRVSDHHEQVILPGTQRLLAVAPGQRVLDVACGQGILCRRLAAAGAQVVGVDAAPRLVERAAQLGPGTYLAGDARRLRDLSLGTFDAASCVMAIMNIEPISSVFDNVAACLKPSGRFVLVMLHPAFRAPGQTSWGWDAASAVLGTDTKPKHGKPAARPCPRQYRRVDGYLSPASREITMNPGAVSSGKDAVVTLTHHRPIQTYITALARAEFAVDALEEWASVRTSQPGPRAAEENRARREIPMFLAMRAVKIR
jgi:RluA family pseudouridine synthase